MNQFPLRREFNFLHKAVDPGLKGLIDGILSGEKVMTLQGPRGTSLACIASLLHASLKRTFVIVMADDDDARRLGADAAAFLGAGRASHLLPWDLPREDRLLFAQRDSSLARTGTITRLFWGESLLLCTSLKALMQRIVPRKALDAYCRVITAGDAIDRDDLVGLLVAGGYRRVPLVEAAGDFSARGDIIDLFVPTENRPYRMEFFGDEVESIRHFKPSTQRSSGEAEGIYLAPAGEIISTPERTALAVGRIRERAAQLGVPRTKRDRVLEMISGETPLNPSLGLLPYFYGPGDGDGGLDDLLAYVPASSIFIIDDRSRLEAAAETYEEEIDGAVERARREERLYPERSWFHLSADRLFERFDQFQTIGLDTVERPERGGPRFRIAVEENADLLKRDRTVGKDEDVLDTAVRRIRGWTDNRLRVFFFCAEREQERIASLLEGYELPLSPSSRSFLEDLADPALESRVILREGFVAGGFTAPGLGAIVVSEEEIFGKKVRRRRRQRYREGFFLKSFGDLNEGDHIVHVDHGIGIYLGLQRLSIGAIEGDFLLIEYLGGDKLYIPMDRLDQIQRYIGPEGQGPAVDRLGGGSWEAVKKKVSKSVRAVAEELVALYAAREVMEGFRFSPPDRHYEEFASSFEFEETPDQAKAIEDVQQDMSESKP
ncbi:MAG: hypothetical protein JW884_13275, partial [Deltaproteobacteria bacterium]|nr:hypothetical protein [Deltaproteobacteria bacterium]